jgi:16S rRNA (adenine1518-N6/adenine1519-N6)-dimethyltransferase
MKEVGKNTSLRAKKSLGQHFLKSERVLKEIISASNLKNDDVVLEIGPGLGHLTKKLLERVSEVIAVEKDDRLVSFLKQKFPSEISAGKLKLVHQDILSFNVSTFIGNKKKYKIVANLPYYITGKFLRKFLSERKERNSKLQSMTLLLQKEVAQRIVAKDGKESLLSISVKAYGTPHYVVKVKKELFKPKPKVDSAILLIDKISDQKIKDGKYFFKIVKKGFSSKRKKLLGNLKSLDKSNFWEETFKICRIHQNARAEELPVKDWLCLTKKYHE